MAGKWTEILFVLHHLMMVGLHSGADEGIPLVRICLELRLTGVRWKVVECLGTFSPRDPRPRRASLGLAWQASEFFQTVMPGLSQIWVSLPLDLPRLVEARPASAEAWPEFGRYCLLCQTAAPLWLSLEKKAWEETAGRLLLTRVVLALW